MLRKKVQQNSHFLLAFLLSIFITGFARPSDIPILSLMAATFGYAIFWKILSQQKLSLSTTRTWLWLQFCLSSLIQTRWLLSHPFFYIVGIWLFLAAFLSIPYALCTNAFLRSKKPYAIGALAASFALLDIIEPHLFFCGISFRSIGSFLMSTPYTSELITLFGGAGLTFLVILANGMVYTWLKGKIRFGRIVTTFASFVLLGGILHYGIPSTPSTPLKVAILHWNNPALINTTSQELYETYRNNVLRVTSLISLLKKDSPDLIVLPEGALPYSLQTTLLFKHELPKSIQEYFSNDKEQVSTCEILQAISDETKGSILIGLERNKKNLFYNSCFLFSPNGPLQFYDKRVLVPGGEYIPLEDIFKPILKNYGVTSSFQEGALTKVLHTKNIRLLPLICYEETLPQYVRPATLLKPDVLISLSNDNWFPCDLFAKDHWLLGKMRAMENGLPLIRCSNMGQSGVILANGQEMTVSLSPEQGELLIVQMAVQQRPTLYSHLYEPVITLFFLLLLLAGLIRKP